jgi:hypothetical protein
MASEPTNPIERQRRTKLEHLNAAASACGSIALNEPSMTRFAYDLEKVERLTSKLKIQPAQTLHV